MGPSAIKRDCEKHRRAAARRAGQGSVKFTIKSRKLVVGTGEYSTEWEDADRPRGVDCRQEPRDIFKTDPAALEELNRLKKRAYDRQGAWAFEPTKSGAAFREAGCAIAIAAQCDFVERVEIYWTIGPDGSPVWRGRTLRHQYSDEALYVFGPDSDPKDDIKRAFLYLAGPTAEALHNKDHREGVNLEDVCTAKYLCRAVARKTGLDAQALTRSLFRIVATTLREQEELVPRMAAELGCKLRLEGDDLSGFMKPVEKWTPMEWLDRFQGALRAYQRRRARFHVVGGSG